MFWHARATPAIVRRVVPLALALVYLRSTHTGLVAANLTDNRANTSENATSAPSNTSSTPCPNCPFVYEPVCGEDGLTYPSECFAECLSVAVSSDGECQSATSSTSGSMTLSASPSPVSSSPSHSPSPTPSTTPYSKNCASGLGTSAYSASSLEYHTTAAWKAFDRLLSSRWSSQSRDDQWLAVDLGEPVMVEQVIILWEAACPSDYSIQVSTDGFDYTDALAGLECKQGGGWEIHVLPPGTIGQHVRMYGYTRITRFGMSAYDFQVMCPLYSPSPSATISFTASSSPSTTQSLSPTPSPTPVEPYCVNDDTTSDSAARSCSDLYNDNLTACGLYDDDDFTASQQCCFCGGGFGWECRTGADESACTIQYDHFVYGTLFGNLPRDGTVCEYGTYRPLPRGWELVPLSLGDDANFRDQVLYFGETDLDGNGFANNWEASCIIIGDEVDSWSYRTWGSSEEHNCGVSIKKANNGNGLVKELTDADLVGGQLTPHGQLSAVDMLAKIPDPQWMHEAAKADEVDDFTIDEVIDWNCGGQRSLIDTPLIIRSPMVDGCEVLEEDTFRAMPGDFTCDPLTRTSIMRASPPLNWRYNATSAEKTNDRCEVKSWVLILDDLLNHKLHWVVTNIDKGLRSAPVGVGGDASGAKFGMELLNSFRYAGYEAPCFDEEGPRSYRFTLFGRPSATTKLPQTEKLTSSSARALLVDSCVTAEMEFGVAAPHTDSRGEKFLPKLVDPKF